jgi:ankyrin repeat protein
MQQGTSINATNESGKTAFLCACKNGHTDIVIKLLNYDEVDVNIPNLDGWTAY